MVKKASRFDQKKTCLRQGTWSPEEDQKLADYINRYGIWNWSQMSKAAGLLRSGKSCRLRWLNYLKPGIKHGNFSGEEDLTIIKLHEELGNKWSTIAARLPGRTDNEIKNHWHTTLKKCLKNNQQLLPTANNLQETETASDVTIEIYQNNPYEVYNDLLQLPNASKTSNLDCCNNIATPISSQLSATDDNFPSSTISEPAAYEIDKSQTTEESNIYNGSSETFGEFQNFWEQPFSMEGSYMVDDYGATYTDPGFIISTTSQWEFQENTYTSASFYYDDHGNDLRIFEPIF